VVRAKSQGFAQYAIPRMVEWALIMILDSGGGFASIVITSLEKTPPSAE